MPEWVYFLHPPRENFAATMTDAEGALWGQHFQWLDGLFAERVIVVVGASGGPQNTGIAIFEAPDEQAARELVSQDPVTRAGYAEGELRPFQIGLLRGQAA